MLTELFAANFKSWPKLGPMRLAPLTGLFGTNSSGKTSVLQLLLMLKQTVESTDRAAVLEFGGEGSLANLGSFRDVVFGHQDPGTIEFALDWEHANPFQIVDPESKRDILFAGRSMRFRTKVTENGTKKLGVSEFSYSLGDNTFSMTRKADALSKYELESGVGSFGFKRTVGRPWDLPAPVKCYGFPDQVYGYFQNAGFLAELQLAFEDAMKNVFYLGPLRNPPGAMPFLVEFASGFGRSRDRLQTSLQVHLQRRA